MTDADRVRSLESLVAGLTRRLALAERKIAELEGVLLKFAHIIGGRGLTGSLDHPTTWKRETD